MSFICGPQTATNTEMVKVKINTSQDISK